MLRKESSVSSRIAHLVLAVTAALFAVLTCAGISFAADPSEHVIHSFLGSPDGKRPARRSDCGRRGLVYSTTIAGGTNGPGASNSCDTFHVSLCRWP